MTRGAPSSMSRLPVPDRELRPATLAACPECRTLVPTRDGQLAGHYAVDTTLCSASSKPIPTDSPFTDPVMEEIQGDRDRKRP